MTYKNPTQKILRVKINEYDNPLNWYAEHVGKYIDVLDATNNVMYYEYAKTRHNISTGITCNGGKAAVIPKDAVTVAHIESVKFQDCWLTLGDKLWTIFDGYVTVTQILYGEDYTYPIHVTNSTDNVITYTIDGKRAWNDVCPSLFWDNPLKDIPRPKKPVPKVKKYLVLYQSKMYTNAFNVSDGEYHSTLEEFNNLHDNLIGIQLIKESEKEFDNI